VNSEAPFTFSTLV